MIAGYICPFVYHEQRNKFFQNSLFAFFFNFGRGSGGCVPNEYVAGQKIFFNKRCGFVPLQRKGCGRKQIFFSSFTLFYNDFKKIGNPA
jgi:hypothetical protein